MSSIFEYSEVTGLIEVTVNVSYLGEHVDKNEFGHVWLYSIGIQNNGSYPVQLRSRHWKIIDDRGAVNKIFGIGIVGEQPIIKSSEKFEYVSGTYLNTSSGIMMGYYEFSDEVLKRTFYVKIPPFSLDVPSTNRLSH